MNQFIKEILKGMLFGLLCAGLFVGGIYFERWDGHIPTKANANESNLSLRDFSDIALAELETFYYYNESNVGKELTLEQLKEEGGVCDHYATWYVNKFIEHGYRAKEIDFYTEDKGHEIALVWDNNLTEYCVLDQLERRCTSLA
jgi:hypothetical protein